MDARDVHLLCFFSAKCEQWHQKHQKWNLCKLRSNCDKKLRTSFTNQDEWWRKRFWTLVASSDREHSLQLYSAAAKKRERFEKSEIRIECFAHNVRSTEWAERVTLFAGQPFLAILSRFQPSIYPFAYHFIAKLRIWSSLTQKSTKRENQVCVSCADLCFDYQIIIIVMFCVCVCVSFSEKK